MHGNQVGGSGTMIDLQCQALWPHIFTRLITSASVINYSLCNYILLSAQY